MCPKTLATPHQKSKLDSLLGNNTKSVNPPLDPAMARIRKWALQEASRQILRGEMREDKNGRKQQSFRVCFCCRVRRSNALPEIRERGGKHHYGNLQVCGSVWVCPVCATVISERRRLEIQQAVKEWERQGGSVVMLTLTVPHYKNDSLEFVLAAFKKARKLQRNRKPWKRWANRYLQGTITAQEVTHGQNGWHVHTHEILFLTPDFQRDRKAYRANNPHLYVSDLTNSKGCLSTQTNKDPYLEMQAKLLHPTWAAAVVSAGLPAPSIEHGLDLADACEVAGYVGKWGVDYELTKAHLKHGRIGGRTPWAILSDFLEHGDFDDAHLYREFARQFKGVRQLVWSAGLKDICRVLEKSDEEILQESEIGNEVYILTLEQWRAILRADLRGQLLEIANFGGRSAIKDYLDELVLRVECELPNRADHDAERWRLKNRG